ncbi:response regulator transcription factor [Nocardioides sp. WV_118_6]|uniref:response regulator transcription factor n=1 Tax=Nocardioides simplex TaxID=2045 RepID=UPI0021505037|nr:response regulator transcription factor [Pimelobacter simplex]UUW90281.1 response regulator transcription factor [Pimelobacter simplex]UUW94110.1 response regulator transcription factor [Pimelobacter simplex]
MGARILVADDDRKLAALVRTYLERAGHQVVEAHDGQAALAECRRREPDLAILDIMMPVLDGHDVCHVLRAEGEVPVIFLTARTTEDDLVRGLGLGADDYVTKPFSPRELVARVEAVLRRTRPEPGAAVLRAGSLVLDEDQHLVTLAGRPVACTPAEFRILRTLVQQPSRVFSRQRLLEAAFGFDHDALERTVDVHVMNLRRKLERDPAEPVHLVTVYGVGYKYVADA